MMTASSASEVYVADSDPGVREVLALALRIEGWRPTTFGDGASVLAAAHNEAVPCVILDVGLPDMSGIEVLRRLGTHRHRPFVIMMSGQVSVAHVVDAMKFGALDFLEKPFAASAMVERVRQALAASTRASGPLPPALLPDGQQLTPREHEVLAQIAHGASNKEAGRVLGISPRTVEVHRARIMDKIGARNAADLMRIVLSEFARSPQPAYSAASDLWRSGSPSRSQT